MLAAELGSVARLHRLELRELARSEYEELLLVVVVVVVVVLVVVVVVDVLVILVVRKLILDL